MANIELMKRLRTRFLRMRHKKHFNMDAIAAHTDCGSAMCIAGHTLVLAGYKMRLIPDASKGGNIWMGRQDFDFFTPKGRKVGDPLSAAAKELKLPYKGPGSKAFDLFHDWSLTNPKKAAKRIDELITEYSK